jgi:hypothetical protein
MEIIDGMRSRMQPLPRRPRPWQANSDFFSVPEAATDSGMDLRTLLFAALHDRVKAPVTGGRQSAAIPG